jgi:hypothetical protein
MFPTITYIASSAITDTFVSSFRWHTQNHPHSLHSTLHNSKNAEKPITAIFSALSSPAPTSSPESKNLSLHLWPQQALEIEYSTRNAATVSFTVGRAVQRKTYFGEVQCESFLSVTETMQMTGGFGIVGPDLIVD